MTRRIGFAVCTALAAAFVSALLVSLFPGMQIAYAASESYSIAGANRYDTAAKQAHEAYPNGCEVAIVACGEGGFWADALSASGLAGALDCPILFSAHDSAPAETLRAISDLGVEKIIVVGGVAGVSDAAEESLRACKGVLSLERIAGETRYETQMAIYRYGAGGFNGSNLWGSDVALVASGLNFPDALSGSYLAFRSAAPIFLANEQGQLSESQEEALLGASFSHTLVLGGTAAVSDLTYGFCQAASIASASDGLSHVQRLGGATRYETSSLIASWSVSHGYASWDKLVFASGTSPYDALAGSVVVGKRHSVVLLMDGVLSDTLNTAASAAGSVSGYGFFGGESVFPQSLRRYVYYSMEMGHALSMGASRLADRSFIWCNYSGVYQLDNEYYSDWIALANRYSSLTGWLILVDTWSNHVVIFSGSRGSWVVEKYWLCSSGAPSSPTVKGQFTVGSRGISFGHGYTCWYWTQFCGDYLFHSVKYYQGSMSAIQDGRLGVNVSAGCVRLDINNAKWIYDTIPSGTKVVVG